MADDGRYLSNQPAIRVLSEADTGEESFSVVPVGPVDDEQARYIGQGPQILTHVDSPAQWNDTDITGPTFQTAVYEGRSEAIHVFGEQAVLEPPTPIQGCQCCSEEGMGTTLVPLGDCEDDCPPTSATVLGTQTWNNRAWMSDATHHWQRRYSPLVDTETWGRSAGYPPFTTPLLVAEGRHYAEAHADTSTADPLHLNSDEEFGRHYVRHLAPVGATYAILKVRMYAKESQMEDIHLHDFDALPLPWEIRTWAGADWSSSATGATAQASYERANAGTVIASGELIPRGGDIIDALPPIGSGYPLGEQENDLVEVIIPVDLDGSVRLCFLIPETLGRFNALDLHDPGSPGAVHTGMPGSRWPGLAIDPDQALDISGPVGFGDVDDQRLANGRVRPAKLNTNVYSSDRYELVFYDLNPLTVPGLCDDCPECDDPENPGTPIPPFVPGYLPIFRKQIGDPTTSLDAFICTLESGAMLLDWHTRGAVQVWGGELIPYTGRSEASIYGSGANLGDLRQAWLHWNQTLSVRSGQTFADLLIALHEGRGAVLQGDYDQFDLAERCQDTFLGDHAILLLPYENSGRILCGDPLCTTFHGIRESTLQRYAEDFGAAILGASSPQRILFAVSRPWTP